MALASLERRLEELAISLGGGPGAPVPPVTAGESPRGRGDSFLAYPQGCLWLAAR